MRIDLWKVSTLVLAGALVTVTSGGFVQQAEAEAQPRMRTALKLLEDADAQLKDATHDKGGHRAAARDHVAHAIEQVKKGIAFDEKN